MQHIPVTSDPAQSLDTTLNGVTYTLELKWNGPRAAWSLDLIDTASQVVLAYGVALVLGVDVLSGFGLGIGSLWCLDMSGAGIDAGPDDLGDRIRLVYFAPGEAPNG